MAELQAVSNVEQRLFIAEQKPTLSVLEIVPDGGFQLMFNDRRVPNWFHRSFVRLLLGWKWRLPRGDE